MTRDVKVLKVYPKIKDNYVKEFNLNGFMTCESKKSALVFKKNKGDSDSVVGEKVEEFIECVNKYGLEYSFDIEQIVTYCEKENDIDFEELNSIIYFE